MKKRKWIVLSCITIVIILLFSYANLLMNYAPKPDHDNLSIVIENNMKKDLVGTSLCFPEIDYTIALPDVPAKDLCTIKINTKEAKLPSSTLRFQYTDINGNAQEKEISDYIICGLGGKYRIEIDSINDNGLLKCSIGEYNGLFSNYFENLRLGQETLLNELLKKEEIKIYPYKLTQ
ncbi:MAG: hypothetical protein CVU91_02355 [Firmicutes bacterium HGW-Firmicutes-16]|nr:MAG: hypothetical protein CVU91_02355 [Firmicutes bacterium HGW-Firmicutes-16]